MDISVYKVDDGYMELLVESGNTTITLGLLKNHETECIMKDLFCAYRVIKDFLGINEEDIQ